MGTSGSINPDADLAARDSDAERGLVGGYIDRLKGGDLGSLPVIFGVIVVWVVFYLQNDRFLSAFNLTNLSLQITALGIAAIGVVMVLFLGEIDLTVGSVAGLSAAIMAVLNLEHGVPGVLALLLALLGGAAVGLFHGLMTTQFGVPSFVVTLAGLIGWQGLQLYVLGEGGTRNITDDATLALNDTFFQEAVAWPLVIAATVAMVAFDQFGRRRRIAAGLQVGPYAGTLLRQAIIAAVAIAAVIIWMRDRGMPLAILILVGLVVALDLVIRRTPFGRHVFAVGGNAEAARRAGVSVTRIRVIVFVLSGLFSAAGGIMLASRGLSANQSTGGGSFLLFAIAAAVIGGTSLFGGRGSIYSALLGALVIGSVANGIALLGLASDFEFMITALVLLAAVLVDATARRGRQSSGR